MDSLQQILGELSDVVGADKVYNDDRATVERVQRTIVAIPNRDPSFAALAAALAKQKNAWGVYGPATKAAVTAFNKLYGWAAHGANITNGTLAALDRPDMPGAAPPSAQPALLDPYPKVAAKADAANKTAEESATKAKAMADAKVIADAKVAAATEADKAQVQAQADAVAKAAKDAQDKAAADLAAANKVTADAKAAATTPAEKAQAQAQANAVAKTAAEVKVAADKSGDAEAQKKASAVLDAAQLTKNARAQDEIDAARDRAGQVAGRSFVDFLKQQAGPLPVWGWVAVGAAIGGILYLTRRRPTVAV